MRPTNDTQQHAYKDLKIDEWQERSPFERRTGHDSRKKNSTKYFKRGGRERRSGAERRNTVERRERWMRVGKWRSELVFDD